MSNIYIDQPGRDPEDRTIELQENLYPVKLELQHTVGGGSVRAVADPRMFYRTIGGVTMEIRISESNYPKEAVCKAVKEICEKAVQCFE